jgi:uncharacterized phage infection (PIP) family protein YhgE
MTVRSGRLGSIVLALLMLMATVTGCGDSAEEKAQDNVCTARDDIRKQVEDLGNLTASTATVQGVQEKLSAIQNDLKTISDARDDLSEDRKQQVDAANQQFSQQLSAIVAGLGSDLSLSGAGEQLKAAAQQLVDSYQQTFAKIDCS